jgi:tetratricopeptide (TPR) repeat protein
MNTSHFLQQLHDRYFSKENLHTLRLNQFAKKWENLPPEEKRHLSDHLLHQGEVKLLRRDLSALSDFDQAISLDPNNSLLWYKVGLSLYEYGVDQNDKRLLLFASKNMKVAVSLDPNKFIFWHVWGNILTDLGLLTDEAHYLTQAKEKLQKAIALSKEQSKEHLHQLYWDYGLLWLSLGDLSGEAVDIRMAIQSLRTSFAQMAKISPDFWLDFGMAHQKMAQLINDNRMYLQAIDYFKKATALSKNYFDAYRALADSYTQLYINTLQEDYFTEATQAFEQASRIYPNDAFLLLEWAQLLGESGKIHRDCHKLKLSIEKCLLALRQEPKEAEIFSQWIESLSLLGAYTNRLDLILEAENRASEKVEQYPESPDLWYALGVCQTCFAYYYNDLDYEETAIEKFQTGLSLDRSHAELWHAIASSHSRIGKSLEDYDLLERACKFYLKAIHLKPSCPPLIFDYALTLLKLGELSENSKILEEALSQIETLLQIQKEALLTHPEWLFHYALILDTLGKYSEESEVQYLKAVEVFHQVLLIDPSFPKIYFHIALSLSKAAEFLSDLKLYEKSLSFFQLSAKQDEEDDHLFLEWGLTLLSLSQESIGEEIRESSYLEAEQKLGRAGLLGNQHAYYYLGCLYALTARFSGAIAFLKKAKDAEVLPDVEELLQDEWLSPLKNLDIFAEFLSQLETR